MKLSFPVPCNVNPNWRRKIKIHEQNYLPLSYNLHIHGRTHIRFGRFLQEVDQRVKNSFPRALIPSLNPSHLLMHPVNLCLPSQASSAKLTRIFYNHRNEPEIWKSGVIKRTACLQVCVHKT